MQIRVEREIQIRKLPAKSLTKAGKKSKTKKAVKN